MTALSAANLATEAAANLADNSSGDISASDVRTMVTDLIDSLANLTDLGANQVATGSGDFVLKTSPTLVTPLLGTPTSGNLANCTAYPIASVANLAANVATFLTTPSSANLISAVTDETGTGPLVFASAPTFTTSIQLGTVSTATGLLKLAHASSSNLTTIQAGNAAAARTYTWPTNFGSSGAALTDAAGDGTLSWVVPAGGVTEPLTLTRLLTVTTATANEGVLASTGYSLTGSDATSMVDLAGTWNTSGTPTAIKLRITNTASNGSSKLMDLGVGASTAFAFYPNVASVDGNGGTVLYINDSLATAGGVIQFGAAPSIYGYSTYLIFAPNKANASATAVGTDGWHVPSNQFIAFSSGTTNPISDTADTILTRKAAASFQLGNVDAASPVAQTLRVQSVVAGNANTAGVNWALTASLSNGNGAPGKIILNSGTTNAASGSQNTATPAITINNATGTGLQFNGYGSGAVTSDGSGNLSITSDETLKDIQGPFTAGLSELLHVHPIRYKWKPESGMETEHEYAGLGARNVRDAIPLAAGQNRDGTLTLQDRALLAALVNAVQELEQRIPR